MAKAVTVEGLGYTWSLAAGRDDHSRLPGPSVRSQFARAPPPTSTKPEGSIAVASGWLTGEGVVAFTMTYSDGGIDAAKQATPMVAGLGTPWSLARASQSTPLAGNMAVRRLPGPLP